MTREPRDERQDALRKVGELELQRLEMKRTGRVLGAPVRYRERTSTGVEIGGAYIPPAPAPSEDAEAIQSALLRSVRRQHYTPRRRSRLARIAQAIVVFGVFAFIGAAATGWRPW